MMATDAGASRPALPPPPLEKNEGESASQICALASRRSLLSHAVRFSRRKAISLAHAAIKARIKQIAECFKGVHSDKVGRLVTPKRSPDARSPTTTAHIASKALRYQAGVTTSPGRKSGMDPRTGGKTGTQACSRTASPPWFLFPVLAECAWLPFSSTGTLTIQHSMAGRDVESGWDRLGPG
jgi:hypothetical protein